MQPARLKRAAAEPALPVRARRPLGEAPQVLRGDYSHLRGVMFFSLAYFAAPSFTMGSRMVLSD